MNVDARLTANYLRGASACVFALALCGCETARWSKQWAGFAPIVVPAEEMSSDFQTRNVSVQAYGIYGYRFGTAGASVIAELPSTAIGWDPATHRVVPVRLAGASDGLDGYVFTDISGRSFLTAKMSRLTVREWKEQALLLETVAPAGYEFILRPNATSFDLDLGRNVEIPSGVATYQCVAAQARELANAEIGRATSDRDKGRITAKELEYVQEKVYGMLASNSTACR